MGLNDVGQGMIWTLGERGKDNQLWGKILGDRGDSNGPA